MKTVNTLKKDYKNALDNLNEYKQSSYYLEKKGNFEITKELIKQNRNDNEVFFYKFNITYPFKIRDKRQENIINNILKV